MARDAWGCVRMPRAFDLYFHSSCFDGIVSSVMTADFLENTQDWTLDQLMPFGYDARTTWLSRRLITTSAVVDFLYHPQAVFWADHHSTTFLTEDAKKDFKRRRGAWFVYNERIGSCACLLRTHFAECFDFRNPRHDEMVEWADKIDSARYASVEEAILGEAPALRVRASLAAGNGSDFSKQLFNELRVSTLHQVAELPLVRERSEEVLSKVAAGLEHFGRAVRLDAGGVAVFDVTSHKNVMISRYAPYYFFPEARYSVGVVRSLRSAKITAMRNPWREFPSIELGKIFENFGGGGHQRVASVILLADRAHEANFVLAQIVSEIQQQDAAIAVGL